MPPRNMAGKWWAWMRIRTGGRTGQGIYSNGARNTLRNSRSSSRTGIQNARMNRVATQARNFEALSSYHNDRNELASPSVIVRFSELSVPRFVSAAITPVTVPEVSVSISVIPAGASIPISVPVVVSTVLSIPPSPSTSATLLWQTILLWECQHHKRKKLNSIHTCESCY